MPQPIPEHWRKEVVRILRAQDERYIEWTSPAFQRWKTDTSAGWKFQAYEAMADALSLDGIEGDETTSMPGQLATYQFLFPYGQMRMYGKVALRNDRLHILIVSA